MPNKTKVPISNIVLKSLFKRNTETQKICHINACSLYPKIAYVREIFDNSNIHIICVSETWLNSSHTNAMVKITNYNITRKDRTRDDKKRGGGVAIYVRNGLEFSIAGKSGPDDTLEYLIARISTSNGSSVEVGCVYNPPDTAKDFHKLGAALSNIKSSDIILLGDFNLNHLPSEKSSGPVLRFDELLSQYGCKVINSLMTHYPPNARPSCIDLIITNNRGRIIMNDQVDIPGISHHDLLAMSYAVPIVEAPPAIKYFRDYKSIDIPQLTTSIVSLNWMDIYTYADPDEQLRIFNNLVLHLLDTHVPQKLLKTNVRPARNKQLAHARLDRDLAHKKWRRSRLPADWEAFKTLNNKAKEIATITLHKQYNTSFAPSLSCSEQH